MRAILLEIDEARYDSPKKALRRIKRLIRSGNVNRDDIPLALGVLASCFRMERKLGRAYKAIQRALACAEEQGANTGELLQRLSMVLAEGGEYRDAIQISQEAAFRHDRAGNPVGVGKTFVDQGGFWGNLNANELAVAAFETSLFLVPEIVSPGNRIAALHGLAVCFHRKNDLGAAQEYARRALQISSPSKLATGRLIWLQGILAFATEQFSLAEERLREAFSYCSVFTSIDATLLAIELVQVQLARGRHGEAAETVQAVIPWVARFDENGIEAAVLAQLVFWARDPSRKLNRDFLNKLHQRITDERARRHRARPRLFTLPAFRSVR